MYHMVRCRIVSSTLRTLGQDVLPVAYIDLSFILEIKDAPKAFYKQ